MKQTPFIITHKLCCHLRIIADDGRAPYPLFNWVTLVQKHSFDLVFSFKWVSKNWKKVHNTWGYIRTKLL